jgi:aminoglycoside phosphotransferase (APT) family kinase protein
MKLSSASEIIGAQFPGLAPIQLSYLGEGYDSTAFEVNGTWVFRLPKADDVERQLGIESRILPLLAEQLPVAIPAFHFHGERSVLFPRRFSGYPKLPGVPAIRLGPDGFRLEAVVEPLGRFLSALHAFPVASAAAAGVPEQRLEDLVEEIQRDALEDFARLIRTAPDAPLDRWRRFLETRVEVPAPARVAVVHNDFAAEHVLVDPATSALTGVIDWSDIAISDPVVDIAGICHWGGEPFAHDVLAAYGGQLDEQRLALARYMAACRGVMDVAFGLTMNRPEYITAGLRALHLCAV